MLVDWKPGAAKDLTGSLLLRLSEESQGSRDVFCFSAGAVCVRQYCCDSDWRKIPETC